MKNPVVPLQKQVRNPAYLCIAILSLFQETEITEIPHDTSRARTERQYIDSLKSV